MIKLNQGLIGISFILFLGLILGISCKDAIAFGDFTGSNNVPTVMGAGADVNEQENTYNDEDNEDRGKAKITESENEYGYNVRGLKNWIKKTGVEKGDGLHNEFTTEIAITFNDLDQMVAQVIDRTDDKDGHVRQLEYIGSYQLDGNVEAKLSLVHSDEMKSDDYYNFVISYDREYKDDGQLDSDKTVSGDDRADLKKQLRDHGLDKIAANVDDLIAILQANKPDVLFTYDIVD